MAQENQQPQDGGFVIPREYLLAGIADGVKQVEKMLDQARAKYGKRYNEKNDYEECKRRFGFSSHERLLQEYELIWQKQSKEPSVIRKVIRVIGDHARQFAINKYVAEHSPQTEEESK